MKREGKGAEEKAQGGADSLSSSLFPFCFGVSDASCCCEEGKGRGGSDQREGASEESEGETDERRREGTKRKRGREGGNDGREEGEGGGKLGRERRKGKGKGKGRNQRGEGGSKQAREGEREGKKSSNFKKSFVQLLGHWYKCCTKLVACTWSNLVIATAL